VSSDTGTSTNTYDSCGNLSTATDARGAQASYSYDAANRLTQAAYSDETIAFTYDAGTNGIGRLTGASDANHSLAWTYDTLGRVIGKGQTVGSVPLAVGYGYTNNDMVKLVTPSGQTLVYAYTNHQITSITVNGTTLLSGVNYFPYGPVSGWTWGNSTTASRTYDTDGKISAIATAADTINFGYDNAFRITGITDTGTGANTWILGYDPLDRLTSATTTSTTDGWTYDANGNRLTQTGTTAITFTPSTTSNQLNSTSGGLVRTYGYDAAGNTSSYQGVSFTFNQRGRATSVISTGSTTNYIYNALGQLIEKYGASPTTFLMYDEAGHLIGEYGSAGALIEETVWMGDVPVATLQPNGTGGINIYYIHTDQLNAPRKITQPSSNSIVWRWDTDPFGTVAPNQNPSGLGTFIYNLRFPGQYYQAETGLNYNYFRDYDPQTGRYIESDPIGLGGGSDSTYEYAEQSPISASDRLGLCPLCLVVPLVCSGGGCEAALAVLGLSAYMSTPSGKQAAANAASALTDATSPAPGDPCQFFPNSPGCQKSKAQNCPTEKHHLLPRQFEPQFNRVGLDIEDYTVDLPRDQHRLLPDGIHTGPDNWNAQWARFFDANPNASQSEVLQQLIQMRSKAGF
jgi:RHS repeat-associated protein